MTKLIQAIAYPFGFVLAVPFAVLEVIFYEVVLVQDDYEELALELQLKPFWRRFFPSPR